MAQPTNGSFRLTALTIAVLISVVGMAVAWGTLNTTVEEHIKYDERCTADAHKHIYAAVAEKVDVKQYQECMKGMERDMKLVRDQITRIDEKLDKVLLRVK